MIREFVKGLLCLIILAGGVVTLLSWSADRPSRETRQYRVIAPVALVVGLSAFLLIHFRKDRAPDFLHQTTGNYFDRGGFCFAFSISAQTGIAVLHLWFQNRFERACRGRVVMKPAQGFFMTRSRIDSIVCEIDCGPGAFGMATLRIPVPREYQGTRQTFEVGASVKYPDGRGRRLRNREGVIIRHDVPSSGSALGIVLLVAGAATGVPTLQSRCVVTLPMPASVAETISSEEAPHVITLWQVGDANELPQGIPDGGTVGGVTSDL